MMWPVWVEIALKSTILLAAAWAATLALRRTPAATRHLVWTACVTGLVALPVLYGVMSLVDAPRPVVPVTLPGVAEALVEESAQPTVSSDWRRWVLLAWMAGAGLLSLRLVIALVMLRRLVASGGHAPGIEWSELAAEVSRALGLRRPVRIRISEAVSMPVSCGAWRHTVLLPAQAMDWPRDRRQVVLLHEMAHAARLDPLTQLVAQAACCLYWFNPLLWLGVRRMSMERERACDDRVLASGAGPADYASHLVEIARTLRGRKLWLAVAIAMAARSQLEARLMAILDGHLRRHGLTPKRVGAALALTAMVVIPLAAMRPRPENSGAVSGVVYDGAGVVPGVEATLRNTATGEVMGTVTDDAGAYRFATVAAGDYEIRLRAPGFAEHRVVPVRVRAGAELRQVPVLRVGSVAESLEVVGRRPPSFVPVPPRPRRIRVGGNVQAARLTYREPPRYPEAAKLAGADGLAILRATILRDGTVSNLSVIDAPHPALGLAAREAVSRWRYEPARLNGVAADVETTIQIRFRLTQ